MLIIIVALQVKVGNKSLVVLNVTGAVELV